MSYTAMYRKFRPQTFEDVKGQDHIVTTLRNQIRSDKLQHAYLFTGTRGTGKTSVAKLLAKTVNCEHPNGDNPCLECASCRAIAQGTSMNVVEIDAASNNGVDNIRQIIEEVSYPPTDGKYKVYIIDEVHMLSIGAFNALLKTLEEPPAYVIFILATTEVHKLPITILSRCQRYDFKHISVDDIVARIHELLPSENIEADEEAIRYVARTADGSLRDALSLFDQCVAFNFGKRLTYEMVLETLGAVNQEIFSELLRHILIEDVTSTIALLEKVITEGRELSQFITDFTWYLRNLLLAIATPDVGELVDMSKDNLARLKQEAELIDAETAMRYIRILSELTNKIRYAANKRVLVEIAMVKLCKPEMEKNDDSLIGRIRELERKLENGVVPLGAETVEEAPKQTYTEAPLPLEKSVPEDVKKVVSNWNSIIGSLPTYERGYLKKTKPSLGPNGELMIVCENNTMLLHFGTDDDGMARREELRTLFSSYAGKEIELRFECAQSREQYISEYADLTKLFPGVVVEEVEE